MQGDGFIRVIGRQSRFTREPVEPLTVEQFESRSIANRIVWTKGKSAGVLTTTVDRYGVTIIETRLQKQ